MTKEKVCFEMALQQQSNNRSGQHHCRDCGVFFESSKSLEVHLQYHKENLLTKWANQAASSANNGPDSENNNIKRNFQSSIAAPADSTEMKSNSTGPGRPSSTTSYPPTTSPFTHPQTPASYSSVPSPYQNDVPSTGPSPSSTSFGYSGPEQYQMASFNGYRSPCQSNFIMDNNAHPQQQQQPQQPPPGDNFILGSGSDFPTAGSNLRSTTPNSPSSSTSFRYMYKNEAFHDKNGVSSSSPQSPHQCEKCGCICENQILLQEHVKSAHPPTPPYTGSAFQAPEFYRDKEAVQGSPDILDLDSQQKVHNYRQTDDEQPPPNPHSVSSMLSPWTNNVKPQYQIPPQAYRVSPNNQPYPPQPHPQPQSSPAPPVQQQQQQYPQQRNFPETFNNVPQQTVPNQNMNTNTPSPKTNSKGDTWKSNEARRPKTYNCSACNKWFTSSGHLKRHYNTTLHKNAVKQSGHPDPATLPISSHHHPNRDPSYIHSSKTPPGMSNPAPHKPKKQKAISPVDSNNTPSPALSSANTEDSSRSNDNVYDRSVFDRNAPNGGFERTAATTHPTTFGNNGFDIPPPNQTVGQPAFDRQTPQGNFEQRTTPGFDPRSPNVVPQNGFSTQEPNRPPSNPSYDYYRDYNRIPPVNQINSTNQIASQPPNFQAGPSASPSGGLPTYPPSLLFLRTPNPTTIFMGENITTQRTNVLSLQHQDHLITPPSTSNHTTTGNYQTMEETGENGPLPSFSNFQNYSQAFLDPLLFPGSSSTVTLVPRAYYPTPEYSNNEFTNNSEFPNEINPHMYAKGENKSEDDFKLENLDYSYVEENYDVPQDNSAGKKVKQVSEKECQTSFSYSSAYEIGFKIKKECFSDTSPPLSPQEFPSSTNLEISEKIVDNKKKRKKKQEESSNMVSSTGSPQPEPKKDVIKCEECDKTFNRICYLTQHNRSFHCGEKPFKCDRCGKRFHSEHRAKDHSRKHGGEKPYKCEICPKSFNHKTDLRRHLCLHTGQKPFPCEHCGKGFIRKDHMLKHAHTHKTIKKKPCIQPTEEEVDKLKIQ